MGKGGEGGREGGTRKCVMSREGTTEDTTRGAVNRCSRMLVHQR